VAIKNPERSYPFIIVESQLEGLCRKLRSEGRAIGFTNGCFDILHAGHVTYLNEAAALADVLIVGLNSDSSMRELKGPQRPIVPQQDRATILVALRSVDYVVIFSDPTPYRLIQIIQPDVLVKGGDYDPEAEDGERYIVGSDIVRSRGGMVKVIDLVEGRSTTDIVQNILKAYCVDQE
jgi:D-beta-D-heptose 7-phosphate kinase/D-beta-D-heptose 1-phosphate adenosyltransferase